MIEPALKKTAIFSIVLHMALFIVAVAVSHRSLRTTLPSPYIVRLVSPTRQDVSSKQTVAKKERRRRVQAKALPQKGSSKKTVSKKSLPSGISTVKPPKPSLAAKPSRKVRKSDEMKKVREKIVALQQKSDSMEKIRKRIKLRESAIKTVLSISANNEKLLSGEKGKEAAMTGAQSSTLISSVLERYKITVLENIESEWAYPVFRAKKGLAAVINIRIMKDGRIIIQGVQKSSGDVLFDTSIIKAIKKASPLPQPPFEMDIALRFRP